MYRTGLLNEFSSTEPFTYVAVHLDLLYAQCVCIVHVVSLDNHHRRLFPLHGNPTKFDSVIQLLLFT